jgi:hypothetical protein
MKKLILLLSLISTTTFAQKTINLFNGKDLNNWFVDVPAMDKDPKAINPFNIRNGLLVSLGGTARVSSCPNISASVMVAHLNL